MSHPAHVAAAAIVVDHTTKSDSPLLPGQLTELNLS
jgi:hypothetical protein